MWRGGARDRTTAAPIPWEGGTSPRLCLAFAQPALFRIWSGKYATPDTRSAITGGSMKIRRLSIGLESRETWSGTRSARSGSCRAADRISCAGERSQQGLGWTPGKETILCAAALVRSRVCETARSCASPRDIPRKYPVRSAGQRERQVAEGRPLPMDAVEVGSNTLLHPHCEARSRRTVQGNVRQCDDRAGPHRDLRAACPLLD